MDAKTLKAIVKPRLVEDAYLNQYLLSRGINPKYVTKNQLVSHSKTTSYLQWKRDHAHMVVKETMMDPSAPTQSASDGGNTTDDVEPQAVNKKGLSKAAILVKSIHKKNSSFGEEVEQIDELEQRTLRSYIRNTRNDPERKAGHEKAIQKHSNRLEKDKAEYKAAGKEFPSLGSITKKLKNKEYSFQKEDAEIKSKTKPSYTHEVVHNKTGQVMGKYQSRNAAHRGADKKDNAYGGYIHSVREIPQIKEDLYDHEKEDKPAATAKKPTFQKPGSDSVTKETPQAAAVLSGGKTLTGTPRDVIEIDPMMKQRKQTPDSQKSV